MTPEEALDIVLNRLEEFDIPYMITGSFASNVHGVPRVTYDADIIIEAELAVLINFLNSFDDDFFADPEAAKDAFASNRMLNIIHIPTGFKIDLIIRKARRFSQEEFQRRQPILFGGKPRWVAAVEDIILSKLEWAKMGQSQRQFVDAVNVAKVSKEMIDRTYLLKWAKALGVEALLQKLLSRID